ncbi:MAG: hypothetical protein ACRC7N_00710 [Clostridium sp.]
MEKEKKIMSQDALEERRKYQREYYLKNKKKRREYQNKYWENKVKLRKAIYNERV